jgi:hypothetical protein
MPVGQLLRQISSRELTEWQALYGLELLPQERTELLLAQLLAMTANIHQAADDEPVQALEFLPWWRDAAEAEQQDAGKTPEEMLAMVEMLNAAFGGEDLRGRSTE